MHKVLIVDDNTDQADTLARALRLSGHEAVIAPNGREALSQVLTNLPDVVLLDLLMPEMDGPSFLEVVRSYLRLQSLPVVILTGLTDSPMVERAQALKVNSVVVKSKASTEDVLKAIDEAVFRAPG